MTVEPAPAIVMVWLANVGNVIVDGLAAEPSARVPALKLLVMVRPLEGMEIGPDRVRLLVSAAALSTVNPNCIEIEFAIVRLPPIGSRMFWVTFPAMSVPRPNGPD